MQLFRGMVSCTLRTARPPKRKPNSHGDSILRHRGAHRLSATGLLKTSRGIQHMTPGAHRQFQLTDHWEQVVPYSAVGQVHTQISTKGPLGKRWAMLCGGLLFGVCCLRCVGCGLLMSASCSLMFVVCCAFVCCLLFVACLLLFVVC